MLSENRNYFTVGGRGTFENLTPDRILCLLAKLNTNHRWRKKKLCTEDISGEVIISFF